MDNGPCAQYIWIRLTVIVAFDREIAQITRDVAAERGYTLIDIHAFTAAHPEWFAKDGVHPSNEGAAAMAQEVYSVLTGK